MMNNVLNKIKGYPQVVEGTAYAILFTMGTCHLLNDMIQSVIPAIYPLLKDKFDFTFAQIGVITLVFQLTSSVLQPFVGRYADRHPQPYSLATGMCFTLVGLVALAFAPNFLLILLSVALIGCGSSVFHPEASRVAQMASGGRKSLAQSIFQVGGNGGSAFGPLLAALIIIPYGQHAVGWFALAALLASLLLTRVGYWYSLVLKPARKDRAPGVGHLGADDFLQIFLQRLHDELLHFLSDGEIRRHGAAIPILPFCLLGRFCRGHLVRRILGRPLWAEICHSVLHPRRGSFHAGHALPQFGLDDCDGGHYGTYHSLRFFGHCSLRD